MDTQPPDLSQVNFARELPTPRSVIASQANTNPVPGVPGQRISSAHGRGGVPPHHLSSIQDSQNISRQEENLPPPPGVGSDDLDRAPLTQSSFAHSQEKITEQIQNPPQRTRTLPVQPQAPQAPQVPQPRSQRVTEMTTEAPKELHRQLSELFTIGKISNEYNISGFKVRFKTLTSEEYTRAWTIASLGYPEGIARESALRQALLAYSIISINGSPLETLYQKNDKMDDLSKKVEVISQLSNDLVIRFFEQGFMVLRKSSQDILDKVEEGGSEVVNFI